MKCLCRCAVTRANGNVLHDSHAEILALRAFNAFLVQECHSLVSGLTDHSTLIKQRAPEEINEVSGVQPFAIRDGLRIWMYTSEMPCGDASMDLIMEAQADATPWPVAHAVDEDSRELLGRGSFSEVGIVRRKPGQHYTLLYYLAGLTAVDSSRRQSSNTVKVLLG